MQWMPCHPMTKAGIRSNINIGGSEDRFNASLTLNYNYIKTDLYSNTLMGHVFLPPNAPDVYDDNGQLNWSNNTVVSNPMAELLKKFNTRTSNLIVNFTLDYRILDAFNIKMAVGYSAINRKEFRDAPLASWAPLYGFTATARQSFFGNTYNNNFIAEPQLTYHRQIGHGKFDAILGASLQTNDSQISVIKAANFISDDLLENIGSASVLTNDQNDFVQYRYVAIFGRLNFALKERLFLNLTARRDGSSRFGPGKQFANFGAFGAGWIFLDHNDKKPSWINFGKIRTSYGVTGNDQIANYQYLQLWDTNTPYQGNSTFQPSLTAKNPNSAWETNRKFEAAIQLNMFKNKLAVEFAWFNNRSSNQLIFQPLPFSTGQSGIFTNLPATVQNSGFEIDTSYPILDKRNFIWTLGFNLTIPENKLIAYPDLEISSDAIRYQIGEPLNILKTYNVSVDDQTGSYVIEDKNGNGRTDSEDRYLIGFLGQKYFGGLQNSIKYNRFTLDLLFSFTKQNGQSYMSNMTTPGRYTMGAFSNQYTDVLNRWQQPGNDSSISKFSTTTASNTQYSRVKQYGNNLIVDASYIRLRNVSLTYNFSKNLVSVVTILLFSI